MSNIMIGSYSLYQLFLYFFTYSFLGWCMEEVYATYRTSKFVNRGFLNGPVCPIYGTGVVIVLLVLTPVKDNPLLLFVCSILLTTLLELVTGFVLEKFFQTKWWDYSCQKYNFKGYICVKFSFIWGIACLIVIDILHVGINDLLMKIPTNVGNILIYVFSGIFVIDLIITILQMINIKKISKEVNELSLIAQKPSDTIGHALFEITSKTLDAAEKIKQKLVKTRIVRAYPSIKQHLIDKINEIKEKNK